ncbi:hypothetical protein HY404_03880 [Candidatus Microgenomates bacterium]|nr:hypothetical protein [Candidatus Microgenomates bacterium]
MVNVSSRWVDRKSRNPQEGRDGEVVGFTVGLQAQFNVDYLIVSIKDQANWLFQSWLYTLDVGILSKVK